MLVVVHRRYRPAAIGNLGSIRCVDFFPSDVKQNPLILLKRHLSYANWNSTMCWFQITGRLHVDYTENDGRNQVNHAALTNRNPFLSLMMIGQDAATAGKAFTKHLPLTGALTSGRVMRGGAALSICLITKTTNFAENGGSILIVLLPYWAWAMFIDWDPNLLIEKENMQRSERRWFQLDDFREQWLKTKMGTTMPRNYQVQKNWALNQVDDKMFCQTATTTPWPKERAKPRYYQRLSSIK